MTKITKHNIFHRALQAIASLAALLVIPTLAHAQSVGTTSASGALAGRMRVVAAAKAVEGDGDKDAVNESIEVHFDNGKLTVIRNGQEIPAAQLRQDGNGIIILDQNGNRLQGSSGALDYVVSGAGDQAPMVYKMLNVDPADADKPAPKVMLGVHMTDTGPALEYHLGLEHGKTTMIMGVYEGLPAHDAGIRQYDIVTKVNGMTPADNGAIREALADKDAGDSVTFTIIHEGETKDVTLKLQKYDSATMDKAKLLGAAPDNEVFGMFNAAGGPDAKMKWLRGLTGTTDLKDLQHLFIAPNGGEWDLKPMIEQHLKEDLEAAAKPSKNNNNTNKVQREGVEDQLERLDNRMAQLEEMLGKLIEQQQKNR